MPSKIANWLIARVTGFPIHDFGCTLKAIRREIAMELSLYGEMHRFIPILAMATVPAASKSSCSIIPRRFGTNQIWHLANRARRARPDTVKYMIHYSTSPMKLFGGIGPRLRPPRACATLLLGHDRV